MRIKSIFFAISLLCFSLQVKADPLKDFLLSCAYGTAAGGLIGVASLAFTDDPGSKMNNIARGASLGLYAGIGFGLYLVYGNPNGATVTEESGPPLEQKKFSYWLEPQLQKQTLKMEGLQLKMVAWQF